MNYNFFRNFAIYEEKQKNSLSIIFGIIIVAVAAAYIIKPQKQVSPSLTQQLNNSTNYTN